MSDLIEEEEEEESDFLIYVGAKKPPCSHQWTIHECLFFVFHRLFMQMQSCNLAIHGKVKQDGKRSM